MGTLDYHGRKWKAKRERILRRDGYMCQEEKRYGRMVPADTVHHIFPSADYPQYAWEDWNLVSLSRKAHNAMHDRETGELTELGREWMRRAGRRRGILHPPSGTG